ncbi:MAG TPA: SRPBCC family protein [Candidatus Limnocylindrales bacterium]|jgi:carbon monoxide dehydrogenase subunit G
MTTLKERIETTLPLDEAFAFVADFANAERWDPGVATSVRTNPGPVGVGAHYRLGVRMGGRIAPMAYEVTVYEPSRRVVLDGHGSGVYAVDEIEFVATSSGTRIDYTADIRLVGRMRLAGPFAGGALAGVGRRARDGMGLALERLAAGA